MERPMNTNRPHFSFKPMYGFSFYLPETRYTDMFAFGAGWQMVNRPGKFLPFITLHRVNSKNTHARIYSRIWHLRAPYNVARVGEWW